MPTKIQMKEYTNFLNEAGKNLKLTALDLHNLTDLLYMVNWADYKTIELNNMDKWFEKFFDKIEEITLADKKDYQKILNKLKKEKW